MTALSVCCLTSERPAMVATMLALLRDVADDIVVAVDSRVDPSELGPLVSVADTVARFEYREPPERSRPWLVSLCRKDTVLSIDGDEVPSAALVAALPALAADGAVVQSRIARRWCFPDERSWLAERPWWPDFQYRLVRRGPLLDFHIGVHGGLRAALPARYVAEPLYHLAFVLRGLAERRQRAREYESQRPGLMAVGGGPLNDTLYVPEHFATRKPEATLAEDRERLRRVMAAADESRRAVPELPVVSAEEIARHLPEDPLEAQGYRARLRIMEPDLRTDPGNDTLLVVEVTNLGSAPIPREDGRGVEVRLGARVLDRRPGAPDVAWALTSLPCDIPAGETRLVEMLVRVPDQSGVFTVEMDLVNERRRWFGCQARFELAVTTRWGRYAP